MALGCFRAHLVGVGDWNVAADDDGKYQYLGLGYDWGCMYRLLAKRSHAPFNSMVDSISPSQT